MPRHAVLAWARLEVRVLIERQAALAQAERLELVP